MIQKRMRMSIAVTLAMLFVMLAVGPGRLAWFYDDVGTAAADFAAAFRQDHLAEDGGEPGGGEAQGSSRKEIPRVERTLTTPSGGATPPRESSADRAGKSATDARPEPQPALPAAEPSPAPDPKAVRDSAAAEVAALGPLHDELIEVLEAIHQALTDQEQKRQARDRVTMARFTKRQNLGPLESYVAAEEEWRVRWGRRSAERAKARLERQIQEARAALARARQSP